MFKRFVLGLLVIGLVGASIFSIVMSGCGKVTTTATVTDPGRLTTPEVTVTLTPSYSDGEITLNLSSVIVSGEAIDLSSDMLNIFAGSDPAAITDWGELSFSIIETSTERMPVDLCFILDNTGSMASRIQAVKDSISAFTATLETAGLDVRFAACAFGD
ncbi:MAG: VWA domain-containing protein, partial [Candidatus Margulisbacteria bacterium]|nr:VWA domain-containing protein [Candidatus Margulisiibacteriota bacterium]